MKVGVLTFHETANYGAMLQTYALQKYINDQGVPCQVINYQDRALQKKERPLKLLEQRSLKGILKYFTCHDYQVSKWAHFSAFKRAHIPMSEQAYSKEELGCLQDQYDAIIAGSDQIWNTEITQDDFSYYLDFLKDSCKKYAYAGSFGFQDWPQGLKEKALPYLKDFSALTVRESRAKELIDEALGENAAQVVVDPTLLIKKSQWQSLMTDTVRKPYIVAYMVDFCEETFDFMRALAEKENLRIIYVHDAIRSQSGMENSRDDSVEEFLNMINGATYVVTGSFHALCLSLVLEKQFFYTLSRINNRNSRLETLLSHAGIKGRRVIAGVCEDSNPIDYAAVTPRLQKKIEESKTILNGMLKEIKKS